MPKQKELDLRPAGRQKAKNLAELNKNLKNSYDNISKVLRPEMDKLLQHEIEIQNLIDMGFELTDDINKFAAVLFKFHMTADAKGFFSEGIITAGSPQKRFGRFERDFDAEKRRTKSLLKDGRVFNGYEFGHQDVTVVGLRLKSLIDALNTLEKEVIKVGVAKRRGKPYVRDSAIEKLPVQAIGTLKAQTIGELRRVKRAALKMFVGTTVINNLPTQKNLSSKIKWQNLATEVNNIRKLQEHITTEKEKYFKVTSGIARVKLKAELKNDNAFKNFYEKAFGTNLTPIIKGTNRRLGKIFKEEFSNKVDVTGIQDSPSLQGKVVKDLSDIALGKTPKTETFSARKTTTARPATNYLKPFKSQNDLKKLQSKAKETMAFVNSIKLERSTKRESGEGLNQREINKLRMKINQRLPAEVRRNMGRPALINQTGRFSNSVQLTELRRGPKTLIGKYAYMFAPYETFENEGQRQWPTGYNPKPLITKSIRNLAMQYTEEKFTLRRE